MDNIQKHNSCIYILVLFTCPSLTGSVYAIWKSTPSGVQLLLDVAQSHVSVTALQVSVQTQRSDLIQLIS
jgi:hypothetical protein